MKRNIPGSLSAEPMALYISSFLRFNIDSTLETVAADKPQPAADTVPPINDGVSNGVVAAIAMLF